MNFANTVWKVISIGFIIFMVPFLLWDGGIVSLLSGASGKDQFLPVLKLYIGLCILYFFICKMIIVKMKSNFQIALIIFILTAIPRLILMTQQIYIPTKDFSRYLNFGIDMYYGNYAAVADQIAVHSMPSMGGLAIWNGIIAKVFSPTLIGFQLANVVMVSLIAVMLFVLFKSYHKTVAIIAAMLFALYPSNIVSTQITTNPHGAILLFLIAIFVYQKALKEQHIAKCICYTCIAGVLITISNFLHQSVIVVILSMLCFCLLYIFSKEKKADKIKTTANTVCILLLFKLCSGVCVLGFQSMGIINDMQELPFIAKIVVGLNEETMGGYSAADTNLIKSFSEEECTEACWNLIKERITTAENLPGLFFDKTHTAWFTPDSYITYWFIDGHIMEFNAAIADGTITDEKRNAFHTLGSWINGIAYTDMLVVHLFYWFALIGLWCNRKQFQMNSFGILTFLALGWICVILLGEMQPRYRYPAMSVYISLAAVGLYQCYSFLASTIKNCKELFNKRSL